MLGFQADQLVEHRGVLVKVQLFDRVGSLLQHAREHLWVIILRIACTAAEISRVSVQHVMDDRAVCVVDLGALTALLGQLGAVSLLERVLHASTSSISMACATFRAEKSG